MARFCRLPRVFPLIASTATARHLPSLALLFLSFSSPTPAASLPTLSRLFSSSAGDSSMVDIGSAESFDNIYSKVQDEEPADSLPSLSSLFSSSAGDSSAVVVGSVESIDDIYFKVQEEKLPAVFYYTAVWCKPCKALAPVIAKLSYRYSKIPIYQVDIDLDGIGSRLCDLKIYSLPTFHFYHKGQKTSEVIGATVKELDLEAAMESLDMQRAEADVFGTGTYG